MREEAMSLSSGALSRGPSALLPFTKPYGSVANGDAGDVRALQGPADRFGLIAVEAGEAGPEQLPVAFGDDRFGKRIGLRKQAAGLTARRIDALPRLAFALQRADLNDPSGVGGDRLDGADLLNGNRLRLGAGSRIGVGHRLRGGGGRYARCRKDAEQTVSGAVVRWLRRHVGPGNLRLADFSLVGFSGLGHDRA